MRIRRAPWLAAAIAAVLAVPGPGADAGDGFLVRRPLRAVPGAGQGDVSGGMELWLRVTAGHRILQGFSVWFRGATDAGSAALWMAKPGETTLEEIASIPISTSQDEGSVSGVYSLRLDSTFQNNPELPLAAETVLTLSNAPVEVRVTSGALDEVTVLRGKVGTFDFREIEGRGNASVRGKRTALAIPPEPATPVDDAAKGTLRAFRRRTRGDAPPAFQGFTIYATGLTEDETYEVWVADDAQALQSIGSFLSTADGLGFYTLDSRDGDLLPDEIAAEDVRDLFGRRVEVRRAGSEDASLVGLFPRLR